MSESGMAATWSNTPDDSLHRVLQLNARLAEITEEQPLLDEALGGICAAMRLHDITCCQWHEAGQHWAVRMTTQSDTKPGHALTPEMAAALAEVVTHRKVIWQPTEFAAGEMGVTAVFPLQSGSQIIGALIAHAAAPPAGQEPPTDLMLVLQTFAQNLAALWHNVRLYQETRQRAHELEILQGRYVDSLWNTEAAALQASYSETGYHIARRDTFLDAEEPQSHLPVVVGENPFGHIRWPTQVALAPEQMEFIQALTREMGNALNNAYLLQTTRAYANQLALATDVSRAATTILDQDLLIQEVVNLIRHHYDLYYVGLFLVDEGTNRVVLRAGTGEAGRQQLARGHSLAIDSHSMIGTAVSRGSALVEQDVSVATAFTFNPLLPDTQAELALPLRTRGRVIGALTVQSVMRNAFSLESVAVLQNLADQVAIAIETASLFAQTQETLAETSRLYETSRQISTAIDPAEVYAALVAFAELSEVVDGAQVLTPDELQPEEFLQTVAVWSRLPIKTRTGDLYLWPKHSVSRLLPRYDVITIQDTAVDPRLDDLTRQWFSDRNLRAANLIALKSEGQWLGTLALLFTNSQPLEEFALQPFRTLADQAAIILSKQQLLREIQAANEQLRQLDRLKTQFLANMSHELRTPLNSIIGFSRVILKGIDGPITTEQEEDLTSIYNNGQHLLRLINEILDMAKIEAGKMTLAYELVNVEEIVQNVLTSSRGLMVEKGLELRANIAPNLPLIEADPLRMRQILNNLLSNAVKYTDEGFVSLTVAREGDKHVRLTVHDSGIGISTQDFDKLFRAFEQVDSSTTRAVGGTGLGLPITKWLVQMHQGTITVDSEIGRGSTFQVTLPIRLDQEETAKGLSFQEALQRP